MRAMFRRVILFFQTYTGLRIKNAIIGGGASIVLIGALFKIMHWPLADVLLPIGMITEAFIFFFQGVILPPHKDYHWEKVFPGLDIAPELEEELEEGEVEAMGALAPGKGVSPIQALLQQPQLPPESLERLKEAIHRLGETMEQLRDVTDASVATKEFTEKTREVTSLMSEMEDAYREAVASMEELARSSEVTREYREGMEQLSGAVKELSELYPQERDHLRERLETQEQLIEAAKAATRNLQHFASGTSALSQHLEAFHERLQHATADGNSFAALLEQMQSLSEDLQRVVEATRQYREGMTQLAQHIATLNRIYGGMVSALGIQQTQQ